MRIIYSLSGQGFGHSARSKEIINHLIESGHDVKIFTYGQALLLLEKAIGAENIFEIPGLVLEYKKNRLVYWKTAWANAKKISRHARSWQKISRAFSEFRPDLVITDFEPLVANLAKTKKIPLISIDNQHQLTNTEIDLPLRFKKELMAQKLIVKSMVWGAKHYLVTSFFRTKVTKKNTFLFPPVIRKEILDLLPSKGDYILVYQGADFEHLMPIIKNSREKFVVFGPHKASLEGNIAYRGFAVEEWLDYLKDAKAVIGTAGSSLICECIYLKKPYLAMPIDRQVEQIINGRYLERLGFGLAADNLTAEVLEKFLSDLPEYEKNLEAAASLGNEALFDKLDEIIKELPSRRP